MRASLKYLMIISIFFVSMRIMNCSPVINFSPKKRDIIFGKVGHSDIK
jgi:hypothetical protein